ncbi:hypothetical protein [Pseudomonas sp. LA5]|uniref:hypothetical protein n=1 Tax=Pseudomonas sp. LA5 TaxID=3027850 RepID=UPI00235EED66|nr:hypothetical protein [Pseudomonas sp. LA5]
MRFLEDQAAARRRTRLCLVLLALVVLVMALASAGLALVFLPRKVIDYLGGREATLVKTGLTFTGVIAAASCWKVRQLARLGGQAVVRRLGALPLDDQADPTTRQLHNVVADGPGRRHPGAAPLPAAGRTGHQCLHQRLRTGRCDPVPDSRRPSPADPR